MGVGNLSSTAIYHERGHGSQPKAVHTPNTVLAKGKPSKRLRPPEEWVEVPLPYMDDFLPPDVKERMLHEMRELRVLRYERSKKKTTRRRSNSRHQKSPYLLIGLLQDPAGEMLTGVTVGSGSFKQRRCRHKRGRREYVTGGPYTKTLNAEVIEAAVVQLLIEALSDGNLIRSILDEAMQLPDDPTGELDEDAIRKRRDQLQAKIQQTFEVFDGESLRALKPKIDAMSAELQELDLKLLRAAERRQQLPMDDQDLAERSAAYFKELGGNLADYPVAQLRSTLRGYIEKVVVDMPTQQLEVYLQLPEAQAMCLATDSSSPTGHETHQLPSIAGRLPLIEANCAYITPARLQPPSCQCTRRKRPA